jgi:hypothetical protein
MLVDVQLSLLFEIRCHMHATDDWSAITRDGPNKSSPVFHKALQKYKQCIRHASRSALDHIWRHTQLSVVMMYTIVHGLADIPSRQYLTKRLRCTRSQHDNTYRHYQATADFLEYSCSHNHCSMEHITCFYSRGSRLDIFQEGAPKSQLLYSLLQVKYSSVILHWCAGGVI